MFTGASIAIADAPAGPDLGAVHAGIAAYYTGTVTRYGMTPHGVDWTCVPTQEMRFVQLMKLCDVTRPFSLIDVGCGYGALLAFLAWRFPDAVFDYTGIDLSAAMIRRARRKWKARTDARFAVGHTAQGHADYAVASGIFNVQLEQPRDLWESFVAATLVEMYRTTTIGFAVNFIRLPAGGQPPRQGLYAADPGQWVDHCTRTFGTRTEVVDGYGMAEFTILARR
jgi:SAM-dependent methyltransferase